METKTKYLLMIVSIALVAVLGISFVTAYNMGHFRGMNTIHPGNWSRNISQQQSQNMQQMRNFTLSVQNAIKNNDFATWKSLMESQLTQDNFNKLVANYQKMQNRTKMMQMPNGFGSKGFMHHGFENLANSTK